MILKRGDRGFQVKLMQSYLTHLGYDTNGVDGIYGSGTEKAVKLYRDIFYLSLDIEYENYDCITPSLSSFLAESFYITEMGISIPIHMRTAFNDYFASETKGDEHSPEVLKMWKDAKLGGIKDDETPWCAGAVSAWLERAGIRSQRSAWARDYLKQGKEIPLSEPKFGCIVVLERGSGGHVGFVTGITKDGKQIKVLGGNQGDCVCEVMFPVSRVLGYRDPCVLPDLPITFSGEESRTEA